MFKFIKKLFKKKTVVQVTEIIEEENHDVKKKEFKREVPATEEVNRIINEASSNINDNITY